MDKKDVIKTTGSVVKGSAKSIGVFAKILAFIFSNLPLVGVVAAILIISSLFLFNPFGWNISLFGDPQIEKTENVVKEVKKISEFTTACYYEESVLKSQRIIKGKEWLGFKTDDTVEAIVLTVNSKVRAGFDLSMLGENDLVIVGDSVSIKLPAPKVFDVVSNPSDYKIFEETGDWGHEEIVGLQVDGKQKVLKNALDNNILQKANTIGKERIVALFVAMGFRAVNVELTDVPIAPEQPVVVVEQVVPAVEEPVGQNSSAEVVPALEVAPAAADTVPAVKETVAA